MTIEQLRSKPGKILALGSHPGILQSILDFDYLAGKKEPSLVGIVTSGRRSEKLFWGNREILIPCFPSADAARQQHSRSERGANQFLAFLNLTSGRKALESTVAFFDAFPNAWGGHVFAEDVPERHALELFERYQRDPVFFRLESAKAESGREVLDSA